MGSVRALDELALHLPGGRAAMTLAAAAGGAGVLLGFWLPRRMLRSWQAWTATTAPPETVQPPGSRDPVELEFASGVVGSLAVAVAVLWMLVCLGAEFAEEWRSWLADRLLLPTGLKRVLVLGPAVCLGVALTLGGALLLVGLHGWQRLATVRADQSLRFWRAIALGAGVGGFAAAGGLPAGVLGVTAIVLTLAGGVLAVGRRLRGIGTPEPAAERLALSAALAGMLAAPVAAAAGLGVVLSGVCSAATPDAGPVGTALGWLAVGSLAGLALVARPRLRGMAASVPLLAAAVFAASGFWRGPAADALRAIAGGAVFAIVVRRAAERTLAEVRRSQAALAVMVSVTVAGVVVGLLVAPPTPPRALAAAGTLLVGAVWLHQRLEVSGRSAGWRVRLALAVVAVALLAPELMRSATTTGVPSGSAGVMGRLVAAAGGDRLVLVLASPETLRDADLGGPRADVVIADMSGIGATARSAVSRLMRRLSAALRPGGVLVLVGRPAELPGLPAAGDPASPMARIRLYQTGAGEEVLVAGAALPARLAAVLEGEARD